MIARFVGLLISLGAFNAWAVTTPDAGTIQRTLPKPEIMLPQAEDRTVIEEVAPETTGPTVTLTVIEFEGNSLVTTEALNAVVNAFIGRPLGMAELEELRQVVGEYYRSQGFWASGSFIGSGALHVWAPLLIESGGLGLCVDTWQGDVNM